MSDASHDQDAIFNALLERTKELNCLYTVEAFFQRQDRPLVGLMADVVRVIPNGWQYADD